MYSKVMVIASILGSLVLFQNCQGAEHGSNAASSVDSKSMTLGASETDDSEDTTAEPADDREDEDGSYVCILDGPGKSVKLAVSDQSAQGQNAVPGVVCMSAHACSDIVSQKMKVKGPERRGYCKAGGNPHVVHLSDDQITALLKK